MRRKLKIILPIIVLLAIAAGCILFFSLRGDNNPKTQTTDQNSAQTRIQDNHKPGTTATDKAAANLESGTKVSETQSLKPEKPPVSSSSEPTAIKH